MNKLLALILLVPNLLFAQVVPTPRVIINGSMWNGTTLSGQTGPNVTEYGAINLINSDTDFNNKPSMHWQTTTDSLVWNSTINSTADNYVIFVVSRCIGANRSASYIDFRDKDGTGYNLILPLGRIDDYGAGYGYGSSNTIVEATPVDTTGIPRIRLWVFQGDSGKFYNSGGVPRVVGEWVPTALGTATQLRKLGVLFSTSADFKLAHISIHSFPSNKRVSVDWVNNYGDSLKNYFRGIGNGIYWIDLADEYKVITPVADDVWLTGDSVEVTFNNGSNFPTTDIWLSRDNGSTWTFLGNTDTTVFSYVVEAGDYTTTALIQINDTDSSSYAQSDNFTILPSSSINIYYPINKTRSVVPGDTVRVSIESIFVDELTLSWSKDSLNWTLITTIPVDTVNNYWQDTTVYIWNLTHDVSGPIIYIKAEAYSDTAIYDLQRPYNIIGDYIPLGVNVCQNSIAGHLIEHNWNYDPSCGWTNPPHRYYLSYLNNDGLGFTHTYNTCNYPYTSCTYPRLDPVYLINGSDTTATYIDNFYDVADYGETISYRNRQYYIANKKLLCNDLVNDIDSLLVTNLSSLYAQVGADWQEGEEIIQIYNVQWDTLSGHYYNINTDFESLNNIEFSPLLIIGSGVFPYQAVVVELLNAPPIPNAAVDVKKIFANLTASRSFFRGIHPKAEKR